MSSTQRENIGYIGIGRLGLVSALCIERGGYNVLGCDIFPSYVDAINNKTLKSGEPRLEELLQASSNLRATTDLDETLEFSDLIFICVATPSAGHSHVYDHSYLNKLLVQMNKRKIKNKHLVVCCTVIPGWTAHVGRYLLRDCENVTLSYNPEFIAQGAIVEGFLRPDMVLIGEGSEEAGQRLEDLYKNVTENEPEIMRMTPESAEITKLSVNCFVTMKISYANQIGDIADKTPGADKDVILRAVGADSRVGGKYLKPGYGFGGPCFPRDNRALGNYAEEVGVDPKLMRSTDDYNKYHTGIMVEAYLAQDKDEFVFENIGYKDQCPVPIIEESQKLAVAHALVQAGKKVTIRDKDFLIIEVQKEFGDIFSYETVDEYTGDADD